MTNILGNMMFQARIDKGEKYPLSVEKAALEAGIKPATFVRTENGATKPDLITFYRVCIWLDADPGELLKKMYGNAEGGRLD
jgi:transcriptional regulator with XRE-family HTH domain